MSGVNVAKVMRFKIKMYLCGRSLRLMGLSEVFFSETKVETQDFHFGKYYHPWSHATQQCDVVQIVLCHRPMNI